MRSDIIFKSNNFSLVDKWGRYDIGDSDYANSYGISLYIDFSDIGEEDGEIRFAYHDVKMEIQERELTSFEVPHYTRLLVEAVEFIGKVKGYLAGLGLIRERDLCKWKDYGLYSDDD